MAKHEITLDTVRNDAWQYILKNGITQSSLAIDVECCKPNFNKFLNGSSYIGKKSLFNLINILYKFERRCEHDTETENSI